MTITINQELVKAFLIIFSVFIIGYFICELINTIHDMNKRNRRRKIRAISEPYKIKYEKLLNEEKFEEAIKFGKKYDYYLKNCYYYW